jgi:hypothetical protein
MGTSYFSYGRMYFKPLATKLLGRIHIDTDNSFVLNESGLQGLYELARFVDCHYIQHPEPLLESV